MNRQRKASPQTLRVLAALLQEPGGWRHGYALSKATGLKPGTLYPLLKRLQQRGLLQARWESSPAGGRPPRHAYCLSLDFAMDAQGAPHDLPETRR